VHEHIARAMYYFSVHLLYASMVGCAAWLLTSIRGASATTIYWIWVATAFHFVVPVGAAVDKLGAPHLRWATPLGAIGGPIWNMTQGRTAVVLAGIWIAGALAMLMRLISRIRRERREAEVMARLKRPAVAGFVADGIPVSFGQPASGSRSQRRLLSAYLASPGNRSATRSTRTERCLTARIGPRKKAR
jgi:hypothetical protein